MASTSARSVSASSPSSRIIARLSASGRAPETARSLTVPLTARSPIEPPGKRSGETTNESVVIARSSPTAPASAIAAPASEPKAGTNSPSISVWVALPPAPWAIVIAASLNFGRLQRTVSMMSRTLRSAEIGSPFRPRKLGRPVDVAHTTSRSLAKRPKL